MRTQRWQQQQQQQRDEQAASALATEPAVPPRTAAAFASSDGGSGGSDARSSSSSSSGASKSDEESDTPATAQTRRKQRHHQQCYERASWDDETLVCLLQLRYVEMDAHFRNDCVTSAELADAWQVLAHELNLRMEAAFSSLQCRARIAALRKRWDEHSIANIRVGTEQRTKHVEAIKLLTRLYRKRVVGPLKQVEKITPRADCRGHKRFAEGVSDTESDDGSEREAWWVMQQEQGEEEDELEEEDATSLDGGADCEQLQADGSAGTCAATAVWPRGNLPLRLERRYLELFRRQVVAEEAIAEYSRAQVETTKQRVRAEKEQLRLARDELELKLFTVVAGEPEEEDHVAYEFVAMKRRQVADRLHREAEREERREEHHTTSAMES
ncbi:hypothetical protein Gpo141_00013848 [Globisporangium polare]